MKKNVFKVISLSCLPLVLTPILSITSCNKEKNKEIKRFDGTDWTGLTKGYFTPDDFFIDPEKAEITYFNGTRICSKDLVIPNYVNVNGKKYKVLIDSECFKENTSIRGSVEFNDFIDEIPFGCFDGASSITKLIFHQFPKIIQDNAFNECLSLKEIYVWWEGELNPNWTLLLESIGNRAFAHCALVEDLKLYGNLTSIGEFAFCKCFNLGNIYLQFCSEDLTEIPASAFYDCSRTQYVYLPESIKTIGNEAFAFCDRLAQIILPTDGMTLELGTSAFANCPSFTGITQSFQINSMGEKCFANTFISTNFWDAPYKVKTIPKEAFSGCQFTQLEFDNVDGPTQVSDLAFSVCANLKQISFVKFGDIVPTWTGQNIFQGAPEKGTVLIAKNANLETWKNFLTYQDRSGLIFDDDHWQIKNEG